jgi:hypothetical protein
MSAILAATAKTSSIQPSKISNPSSLLLQPSQLLHCCDGLPAWTSS